MQTFDIGIRTTGAVSATHRNQCTYEKTSKGNYSLNLFPPTAGTVDFKKSLAKGHLQHDVDPIVVASMLDGATHGRLSYQKGTPILSTPGKNMNDYFKVRPLW